MAAMEMPAGKCTRTAALSEFSVAPLPSCPYFPRPQAHRVPLARSAYSVELELPTWMTGEDERIDTAVGDSRVAWMPRASVNVPQCSTGQARPEPASAADGVAVTITTATAEQTNCAAFPRMTVTTLSGKGLDLNRAIAA